MNDFKEIKKFTEYYLKSNNEKLKILDKKNPLYFKKFLNDFIEKLQ